MSLTRCADLISSASRKKAVRSERDMYETPLQRSLTTFQLVLMGMGLMIGSGLYVLTGVEARNVTGPAIVVSYAIAAIASMMSALCYVEFACAVPRTGSAYIFTYIAIGEIWAFLIGWNMVLEYAIGAASVSTAFIGYVDFLAGGALTNLTINTIMGGHLWDVPFVAPYPGIFPALLIILLTVPILLGTRLSSLVNGVLMLVNAVVLAIIIVVGFTKADIRNWKDYGGFAPYGVGGIMSGSATMFYSYFGFDVIAIANEETINPKESIPKATITAVSLTCLCYILPSAVLTLMVPYTELDIMSAFAEAFERRGVHWASWCIGVGALCAMFNTILLNLYCIPRTLYAMASDGLLFSCLGKVNSITKVPINSTIVSMLLSIVLALFFSLPQLVEFLAIGGLLGYAFVSGSVIIVRYKPCVHIENDNEDVANMSPSRFTRTSLPKEENNSQNILKLPGSLKYPYLLVPVLRELARFQPGRVVGASLCFTIFFMFGAMLLIEYRWQRLIAREWWSILFLSILCICALLAFLLITFHHQNQGHADYYRAPFVPGLPVLSIMCNLALVLNLKAITWVRFLVWVVLGLLVYIFYGYRYSKAGQASREGLYVELTNRQDGSMGQECSPDGNTYGTNGSTER